MPDWFITLMFFWEVTELVRSERMSTIWLTVAGWSGISS
jgi:hypothetical protein